MIKIFTVYRFKMLHLFVLGCCILKFTTINAQQVATAYLRDPVVYIHLMLPSADSMLLIDGTAAMYANKFSAAVDQYDAAKLSNFFENICLERDNKNLAVEARPVPKQNDTLFIKTWGLRKPAYDLRINFQGMATLLCTQAWLIDNYLHTKTAVKLFDKTIYSFSADADTGSYLNRFMLVFNRNIHQDDSNIFAGNVKIFPNPVTGNKIILQFNNMPHDNYKIILSSLTGNIILNVNITHNGGSNTYYLPLNSVYTKGLYSVTISSNTKNNIHLPVILNN